MNKVCFSCEDGLYYTFIEIPESVILFERTDLYFMIDEVIYIRFTVFYEITKKQIKNQHLLDVITNGTEWRLNDASSKDSPKWWKR